MRVFTPTATAGTQKRPAAVEQEKNHVFLLLIHNNLLVPEEPLKRNNF